MAMPQKANSRIYGISRAHARKIIALSLAAVDSLRENPTTLDELKANLKQAIHAETDRLAIEISSAINSQDNPHWKPQSSEARANGPS